MNEQDTPLDVDIIISEEDQVVYVKLSGFRTLDQADNYAVFLSEYLPLMLFQSTVIH